MILKKRYKKVIREMLGKSIKAERVLTGINYYIWFGLGVGWILVYYYISDWKELRIWLDCRACMGGKFLVKIFLNLGLEERIKGLIDENQGQV